MVGHEERARLMKAHAEEPICVAAIVAKCSVCLALIAGIAALGAAGTSFDTSTQAQSAGAQAVANAR